MNAISFSLLMTGVLLNAGAQLLLKAGTNSVGVFEFSRDNIVPVGWRLATEPHIVGGLACYVISVVVWVMALSRVEVSVAYPLLSIGLRRQRNRWHGTVRRSGDAHALGGHRHHHSRRLPGRAVVTSEDLPSESTRRARIGYHAHDIDLPTMTAPTVSVIIPVYNEERRLPLLFARLYPALDKLGMRMK